jgi:hypothetical protein
VGKHGGAAVADGKDKRAGKGSGAAEVRVVVRDAHPYEPDVDHVEHEHSPEERFH